jgi:hypothetical protein
MYKQTKQGIPTPTAMLAINKSRMKIYGKNSEVPTYYLTKGQEFQIELFNPTKDTILAKISLNGKPIAQGGLVLKPAQRVFLDRYIDVARKFKFDTYEVANTSETRKAIEDNGDFNVEFYKEVTVVQTSTFIDGGTTSWYDYPHTLTTNTFGGPNIRENTGTRRRATNLGADVPVTNTSYYNDAVSNDVVGTLNLTNVNTTSNYDAGNIQTLGFMDMDLSRETLNSPLREVKTKSSRDQKENGFDQRKRLKSKRSKKSIETGRVEMGSSSDQTLETVYMNWETSPFHTVKYKMLPLSQKVNTVDDVQVKRYCTSCGNKQKPNFKFCPSCGTRA